MRADHFMSLLTSDMQQSGDVKQKAAAKFRQMPLCVQACVRVCVE